MIPYARQSIVTEDVQAVCEVLKADFLTQGPRVPAFEAAVAEYVGARFAVAVSSGAAALHLACLAAGLGEGDWLWTTPNTFVASANCGRYCGAGVDFVDVDPKTYNLSVVALAEKLDKAKASGRLPKVVVPVHFSGQSCDMAAIRELTAPYGITVIEDAAHALGGQYRNTPVGSGAWSDMTILSFHPVKHITTGEGGMVLTNDPALYQKLQWLRSNGVTRDPDQLHGESHGPWYYEQVGLGYNYRMSDLQAALGLSQLQRLDAFVARRRALAERYDALLEGLPLVRPYQAPWQASAWHLYVIKLSLDALTWTRRQVFEALRAAGIGVNVHYIPVHTQPYYRQLGFAWGDFPVAEAYYQRAITLPLYPELTDAQQDTVVQVLCDVLAQAAGGGR